MRELAAVPFSLDDLRRDVRYACLKQPGPIHRDSMLDPYAFISQPAITRRLGLWICSRLETEVDRLVGVGSSALGLALAAGLEVGIPVAFGERHGTFGELTGGDRVAIIADITRTGESTIHTIGLVEDTGAKVVQAFVVWDRALGALEALARYQVPLHLLIDEAATEEPTW